MLRLVLGTHIALNIATWKLVPFIPNPVRRWVADGVGVHTGSAFAGVQGEETHNVQITERSKEKQADPCPDSVPVQPYPVPVPVRRRLFLRWR